MFTWSNKKPNSLRVKYPSSSEAQINNLGGSMKELLLTPSTSFPKSLFSRLRVESQTSYIYFDSLMPQAFVYQILGFFLGDLLSLGSCHSKKPK